LPWVARLKHQSIKVGQNCQGGAMPNLEGDV
jgi:hypothetical protein